jgi:hypothetical protein
MRDELKVAFIFKFSSEIIGFYTIAGALVSGDILRFSIGLGISYICRMIYIALDARHLKKSKSKEGKNDQ